MFDKLYDLFVLVMTFLYGLFGKEYTAKGASVAPEKEAMADKQD